MTELKELKAAAKAATAGRWESSVAAVGRFTAWVGLASLEDDIALNVRSQEEAEFIAAANPATVLGLIAQIEAVATLHKPRETEGGLKVCDHCCSQYPCHTVKAIGDVA